MAMNIFERNYNLMSRFANEEEALLTLAEDLTNRLDGSITRAQAKELMSHSKHKFDFIADLLLNYAVELREPLFIRTAIDISTYIYTEHPTEHGAQSYMCMFTNGIRFLNDAGKREVLKSLINAKNFFSIIVDAMFERERVFYYAQLLPNEVESMYVDDIYKAAWVILNGHAGEKCLTDWETFSLKQLKTALKNVERIDRYARISHIEYDYSKGMAKEVHDILVALGEVSKGEFTPIFFETSEDMAAEGELMSNCIAGSWNAHTVDAFYCACIYKGVRIDIEIGLDFASNQYTVFQVYEHNNASTDLTAELQDALDFIIDEMAIDKAMKLEDVIKVEAGDDYYLNPETGEIIMENREDIYHEGTRYILVDDKVYKQLYVSYITQQYALQDITGTEEAGEVLDKAARERMAIEERAKLESEYDALFADEDDSDDFEFQCFDDADEDATDVWLMPETDPDTPNFWEACFTPDDIDALDTASEDSID